MNLGFARGDSDENVAQNYRLFCAAAGFDPESLVCGAQDHHINIRRVGAAQRGVGIWREKDMDSIDGLCTNDPGVTLVIYCADCVPLYFVDREHRAIGLAHAGWRGTAAGMAQAMVERMAQEFGSRPEELLVAIGPSIGKGCFEVDEPVAAEFQRLPPVGAVCGGPPAGEVPRGFVGVQPAVFARRRGAGGAHHRGAGVHHVRKRLGVLPPQDKGPAGAATAPMLALRP